MKKLLLIMLAVALMLCSVEAFAATTNTITYIVDPEGTEDLEALTPRTVETLDAVFSDAASPYTDGDEDIDPFTDIRIVLAGDITGDFTPEETITIDDESALVNISIESDTSNKTITSPAGLRHFIINKSGLTFTISNVTLEGNPDYGGGGIWLQNGTLNATNTTFTGNDAGALTDDDDTNGGAVHVSGRTASAALTTCTFTGNTAPNGGAVYAEQGALTISGGTFSGNGGASDYSDIATNGGAVYITANATLTIDGTPEFSGNSASASGGAIYTANAITLTGGTFTGNSAGASGGAVHFDGVNGASISGATFGNDTASGQNSAGNGGGVSVSGGSLTLSSANFYVNSGDLGGGMYIGENSAVTFGDGNTFRGNVAVSGGGVYACSGAEMYAQAGTMTFTRNSAVDGGGLWLSSGGQMNGMTGALVFTGNTATNGGGIYISERTSAFVLNSSKAYTFTENIADYGGAIYTHEADVLIEGIEISGNSNTANYGGGFLRSGGTATVQSATISGQSAKFGGAVYSVGDVSISNSAFTGNSASTTTGDYPGGGGAVYAEGKLTVTSSDFSGNRSSSAYANHGGGAIFVSGDAVIEGSVFSSNQHTNSSTSNTNGGGAVYAANGTLTVTGSTFTTNRATGASASFGGAVYATGAKAALTDTLLQGNTASGNGGSVVFLGNSTATVAQSTFTDNASTRNGGAVYAQGTMTLSGNYFYLNRASEHGGAIYFNQHNNPEILGTATIETSMFTQNSAGVAPSDGNGGALYLVPDTAVINRCTFDSNISSTSNGDSRGGGLYIDVSETIAASPSSIRNSVFWNNQTGNGSTNYGGAIYSKGNYTVTSCTIANNSASPSASRGGGVYVDSGTLTITATILVGNYSAMGRDVYAQGSITSRGYNRIGIYAKGSDTSWKADISDSTNDRENSAWTVATFFGENAALTGESSEYTVPKVGSSLYETVYLMALLLNEAEDLSTNDRATNIIPYGRRFVLNIEQYDIWGVDRFASGNDISLGASYFGGSGGGGGDDDDGSFDIAGITMSGIPNTLKYPGQTASLIAMIRYTNGRTAYGVPASATSIIRNQQERVIWSSSNSNAVKVDQNGNITALRATSGANGVTISVETVRYTLAGSPARASRNVIVTDNNGYDYMNISPEYYNYLTQNVYPNLFEYDISAAIADMNPQTVRSSTFRSNFGKVWAGVLPSQITELTTYTPTIEPSTSAPAVSGKRAAKRAGVRMHYGDRAEGELLAMTYSWTLTGNEVSGVLGYDMTGRNMNATLAGDIFEKYSIEFAGSGQVIPVIGNGGMSGVEAYESGMLEMSAADGGAGLHVNMTVYVGNMAVNGEFDGAQVIRGSGTGKALVVPDGVSDSAISGSMWMLQPASTSTNPEPDTTTPTTDPDSKSNSGGGGGCDTMSAGMIFALIIFLMRRHS